MLLRRENSSLIIFKSFLISFLLILILPIVFSSLTYYAAASVVEKQSSDAKLSVLEQTRDIIDKYWNDMGETSIQLSFDSRLSGLFNLHAPLTNSPNLFDVWNYYKDIRSRTLTNSAFQDSLFIILRNSDLAFSKSQVSNSTQEFYNDVLTYENLTYDEWYALLFRSPHFGSVLPAQKAVLNGTEKSVITYMTSLPLGSNQESQSVIVFTIDEQEIDKLVGLDQADAGSTFAILDGDGKFVTSDKGFPIPSGIRNATDSHGYLHAKALGKDHLFVYTRSKNNDWTYVASLPMEEVMSKVYYIRKIAILVAAATLAIGIAVSLLLANRHSKPIRELVTVLKAFWGTDPPGGKQEPQGKPNEVDYLQGSITRLIDNSRSMQLSLQRQEDAFRNVFMERLFKGEFEDRSHMDAMLAYLGLDIRGNSFAIAVINIYRRNHSMNAEILEELSVFRALVEDVVRNRIQNDGYLQIMHENELAVLITSATTDKAAFVARFDAVFQAISSEIKANYLIAPMIGIGDIYADLLDVRYSFQEARQAVHYSSRTGKDDVEVVWHSQIKMEYTGYYYPTETEIRLMNVVKAGNGAELLPILQHIHHENFEVRTLPVNTRQHLLNDIQATALKLKDDIGRSAAVESAGPVDLPFEGLDSPFQDVFVQFVLLCQSSEKNKKSHNNELMAQIVAYIHDRFQDSNLSLYAIASHFNLSESYLSQFFKEQCGETFSAHVERLRISLACKLVADGALSIDHIAATTGYNSTHSFRRAFKRVMGVSPSSYKQL